MKHPIRVSMLIHPLVLLCASSGAHAQSSVSLYGIADAGIRYATNANAGKDRKFELSEGALTGSRFGLRGEENLGGSLLTFFQLEGGFDLGTGASLQSSASTGYAQTGTGGSGRLFGRQAFVGIKSEYGAISFGRQYSVGYQSMAGAQIFGNPNLDTLIIVSKYTGSRQDNAVKYEGKFGGFSAAADYAFGEITGNTSANSAAGVALGYMAGGISVGLNYTTAHSADGREARRTVGIAGGYAIGPFKATLGYLGNRYKTAETRNDVFVGGLSYTPVAAWLFGVGAFRDKQRDPGGSRATIYGMIDYRLSKRTNVYLETDYNRITGRYELIKSQGVPGGKFGAMLGLRHLF